MRIAKIENNDMINGIGVCTSVWFQGCPYHCPGCHNPETWDFKGGYEISYEELEEEVLNKIGENGIIRNLSLLGGEPLCQQNIAYALKIAAAAKEKYPNIRIFCWTGNFVENIIDKYGKEVLEDIDVIIDGPFILEQRDITLPLRGSKNQRVLYNSIDF